ncbi:uncharacterized protein LOC117644588 [Thrips palmi]|uniref:Uncharacterized protein LOC117644588 n=1 Tax=Thrips palmi TaxID=161013 RepID=A0A6P8YSM2_THRPL|nr:uncharacterized protein LOC117644588 [Thrips palmi]
MANLCAGKAVMVISNALFLVSGLAAVALGALLLSDAPRVLMSRLILAAGVSGANATLLPPQPLLYYVCLAVMALGLVVCAVAVLGCWASCLHSYCILGTYLFLLTLLLLGELAVGALAALGPQFLGLAVEHPRLTDALQRGYGVPGREQFTAAFDLAQVTLRCCGVVGGSDYHSSWWHLRELGQRDLLVPLSCCSLDNVRDPDSFLDPRPTNLTLCQSLQQDVARPFRHMEGCGYKIGLWLGEQVRLLASAGGALVLVQLVALLSAILVCVQLPRCRQKHREQQLQLQEQQDMQLRMTPRSENGFLDYDHTADKYASGGDTPPAENNNTLLTRVPGTLAELPPFGAFGPYKQRFQSLVGPPVGHPMALGPPGRIDMVDASVYHLPMPTEITPVMGPLHMGAGSPVQGSKYVTEEVVYQQSDGAVKYSLPPRRSYQPDAVKPPKPPPKPTTLPYDMCNCDLQKFYQSCYTPGGQGYADTMTRTSMALEPSPYQYMEELRASPYQQALAYHGKRASTRPKPDAAPKQADGEPPQPHRPQGEARPQGPQGEAQPPASPATGSAVGPSGTNRSRRRQHAERERQLLQEVA